MSGRAGVSKGTGAKRAGFRGPKCWAVAAAAGGLIGLFLAWIVPPGAGAQAAPLGLCAPFAALLLSIALVPLVSRSFWHDHYPDFALFFGALVLAYSLAALGVSGRRDMLCSAKEYYAFIALVGGLYVASGGVFVNLGAGTRATPASNTLLLGAGCVLANLVGTTGASVLLIRPFLRLNRGRLRPIHAAFFIFTVSNCAGALTPIGDPPLYLGYLRAVPFFWMLTRLWPMWLLVNGLLLAAFYMVDRRIPRVAPGAKEHGEESSRAPLISGWSCVGFLALLVAGVFVDPMLRALGVTAAAGWPVGATFQIVMAACAYFCAAPANHRANHFTFEPVKEVGFVFIGVFLTMTPALVYLGDHAGSLGLQTPTQYHFYTGLLSAVLDNAPTFVSFLRVAMGTFNIPATPEGIALFINSSYSVSSAAGAGAGGAVSVVSGQLVLEGICLGSVFFGALTYIGNGPNFMVKTIIDAAHDDSSRESGPAAERLGTAMPSFFGYVLVALLVLGPVLLLNWAVFIR